MILKDAKPSKIEWLASCAPKGNRCLNCDWIKKNYRGIGGRIYPEFCQTYQLEVKNGEKVGMCVDICNLENLEHLK